MTIFLVGYMGCGKSTLGKKLAINLNYDFIDLDNYIEEQEGRTIKEIFADDGTIAKHSEDNKTTKIPKVFFPIKLLTR